MVRRMVLVLMVLTIAGTGYADKKCYGEETGKDWNSWSERTKYWFMRGYLACMRTCMARLTDKGIDAGLDDNDIIDRLAEQYHGYFESIDVHIAEIDLYYAIAENANDEIMKVIPYIWGCHWWDVKYSWQDWEEKPVRGK